MPQILPFEKLEPVWLFPNWIISFSNWFENQKQCSSRPKRKGTAPCRRILSYTLYPSLPPEKFVYQYFLFSGPGVSTTTKVWLVSLFLDHSNTQACMFGLHINSIQAQILFGKLRLKRETVLKMPNLFEKLSWIEEGQMLYFFQQQKRMCKSAPPCITKIAKCSAIVISS